MREHFIPSAKDPTRRIHVIEYGGRWWARVGGSPQVSMFWRTPRGDWGFSAPVDPPPGLAAWSTDDTVEWIADLRTVISFFEEQQRYFKATEL